jgi:hypothetical protein
MSESIRTVHKEHPEPWRVAVVVLSAVVWSVVVWMRGRIPQSPEYFQFVDGRDLLGIPNAWNVLSNLAFAIVGPAGLWVLGRGRAFFRDSRERTPWAIFYVAVALTSAGSAWFHLAPSNASLVWDRLPMSVAFMALLAALITERIDARAGALVLPGLLLAGAGSVALWWWTERVGAGDLRPYFIVQFYPLIALPLVLTLFPARYSRSWLWLIALSCYVLAKFAEVEDELIFRHLALLSGHTVKHLLAAGGIGALVWMVASRRALETHHADASAPSAPQGASPDPRYAS